jgi:RimJ/RimL family protein N-acetyltransferase
MSWLAPVTLAGRHVTLVPLSAERVPALIEAARDGDLWKLWYTSVPAPDTMTDTVADLLRQRDAGTVLPFAVLDPEGVPVGMTRLMNLDPVHKRLEIGGTWYGRRVQRSPLNTECKRLLLTHAFEQQQCIAVEFRTHRLNQQSRRAIERLGAQLDGILRAHQRTADGNLRDTAVYSITAAEWPTVRAHLTWQLDKPR